MADSKKYIGIYNTLEDVQDALDNGQLSKPYVAKTTDNGQLDYNSLSPVDYSQYWCTYYPIDAKIWVTTALGWNDTTIEYTGGDGKISKADFPDFYGAGAKRDYSGEKSTVAKFKYFQFDSMSSINKFEKAWENCSYLTSFPLINTSNGTNFSYAWKNCSSLTEVPMLDVSNGTNFDWAWAGCSSLTEFPMLDLSNGTEFGRTWDGCSSLTKFPMLDVSKGTNFSGAWDNCSSLTEFPMLDVSNGTGFGSAWYHCSSLTSFPQLDLSSGTNFEQAWNWCSSLTTMPALDLSSGTDFSGAWEYCSSLTTLGGFGAIKESIDLSPCSKLTVDSIMNVITQAADLNSLGITGKTMKFGSTNLNKLTDEQKAVATSKGWTLA